MSARPRANPAAEVSQGDVVLADRPAVLSTVLGSCVAVTFWWPRCGIGAMCHCVLPDGSRREGDDALRYVRPAIRRMLELFESAGAPRRETVGGVFGGAEVLAAREDPRRSTRSVGSLNVEKAFEVLEEEGIEIAGSDVGGNLGRKILFDTATGEVLVRYLPRAGAGCESGGRTERDGCEDE